MPYNLPAGRKIYILPVVSIPRLRYNDRSDKKQAEEEDGSVFISGTDIDNCNRALTIVKTIVEDPEVGAIYKGRVTRLMDFGAFVEIAPGKEGLVHISRLDVKRTEKVTTW